MSEPRRQRNFPPIFWMVSVATFSGPWVFDAAGFKIPPMNWAVLLVMISYFAGTTAILKLLYDYFFKHRAKTDTHAGDAKD